jgi:sigma-B regulation protein RsbU (phosphoserine phosphatase)
LSKNALIAEDDPVSLHILKSMLEQWGYDVITAVDGAEAFHIIRERLDLQLVISDWMMPNVDGLELCQLVRNMKDRPYTYFILLTARSHTEDVIEGMEAGADDFISKPFNQFELKVRVRAGERVLQLQSELAHKVQQLSEASDQMTRDIEAAAAIQMSMLPLRGKAFPGITFAYNYTPCDRIGGDFFNMVDLDGSHVGVYILDASGHGVPAALQSVAIARMLSAFDPATSLLLRGPDFTGPDKVVPPKEVTLQLNSRFQFASTRGDFITFLYGMIDLENLRFTYTRAGHPAPLVISDGKAIQMPQDGGIPIGIIPAPRYSETTVPLKKRNRLYFFTDGLTELASPSGDRFGLERLTTCLESASVLDLEKSIAGIIQESLRWQKEEPRVDDLTILGIEINA